MRVGGEERRAPRRPEARGGEGVRRARQTHRRYGVERMPHGGLPTRRCGQSRPEPRQAQQRRIRRIGHQVAQALGRQVQHQLRAQRLARRLVGQLQRHQFLHRERIRRDPGRDLGVEQEELRRPAPQRIGLNHLQPGVHPVRIGIERRPGRFRLRRDARLRQPVEVEGAHQPVDLQRLAPEELAQAPLRRAPHQGHLPQPVLGVREAEAEERVEILGRQDVGHGVAIAHDLDRRAWPLQRERAVVVRQRLAGEIIRKSAREQRQQRHPDHDPHQPSEHQRHAALRLLDGRCPLDPLRIAGH